MAEATKTENLAQALAKVQGELPKIPKNKEANYGTYADLDTIHEKVLPVLSKNGLAWVTMPGNDEAGNDILNYVLLHGASNEKIEGAIHLRLTQDNMQQLGSAITYARRYAISAVIGVTADEDDDGNTASGRNADGTGETKAAPAKRYPAKKPDVFPDEEPAIDINADVAPVPMTTDTRDKLVGAFKLKGFTDKAQVIGLLDRMAFDAFQTKSGGLTNPQALELYEMLKTIPKDQLDAMSKEV